MGINITIGDSVKLVSPYGNHIRYTSWATKHNMVAYQWDRPPKVGCVYSVIAKGAHLNSPRGSGEGILGIEDAQGAQYIVDRKCVMLLRFEDKDRLKRIGEGLLGKKIKVTPEISELVQKAVFETGGRWEDGIRDLKIKPDYKGVQFLEAPYLFIYENGHIRFGLSSLDWEATELVEVELNFNIINV